MPEPNIKNINCFDVVVCEGQAALAIQCQGETQPTFYKIPYDCSMTAIAGMNELVEKLHFIEAKRREKR